MKPSSWEKSYKEKIEVCPWRMFHKTRSLGGHPAMLLACKMEKIAEIWIRGEEGQAVNQHAENTIICDS